MKPILYGQSETSFKNHGIGTLYDCVSCTVTEERNGIFELEMKYPITGIHFAEIQESKQILAVPAPDVQAQPFRIYHISKPLNGIITIKAQHSSYQLVHIPVLPFTAGSAVEALAFLKSNAAEDCPFEFSTDVTSEKEYKCEKPQSARACLGGSDESIVSIYNGELEWDRFHVYLKASRGENRGVSLKYGKNIIDIKQEKSIANTITGIMPFWYTEADGMVMLPEKSVSAENAGNYPYKRTVVKDFTADFQEKPTEEELRAAAKEYVKDNNLGIPEVNITVSFAILSESEQYKHLALFESVYLCDTVNVEFERLGISAEAKVIKTVYNVLKNRYDKVEIGEAKSNLTTTMISADKKLKRESKERKTAQQQLVNTLAAGTGLFMTVEIQDDGTKIYYMHEKQSFAGSQIIWKLTEEVICISVDGGKTWPYEFDISGPATLERIRNEIFQEAFAVNYGLDIFNENADNPGHLNFHSGFDAADGDDRYDYTGQINNTLDSDGVSQFCFNGYRTKTGETGTCNVSVNGTLSQSSDRRLKEEVRYLDRQASEKFLMSLRPAQYRYTQDPAKKVHKGLIYDEVEAVVGDPKSALLSSITKNGVKYGALAYTELIPDLIAVLQKQHKEIAELKKILKSCAGANGEE